MWPDLPIMTHSAETIFGLVRKAFVYWQWR